jgi:hypothetical protein
MGMWWVLMVELTLEVVDLDFGKVVLQGSAVRRHVAHETCFRKFGEDGIASFFQDDRQHLLWGR